MPEPKRDDCISMKRLREHLDEIIERVLDTKQPMYVWHPRRAGIAILELEEYNELVRLAEKGLIAEIVAEAERSDREGDSVPWEVIKAEWEREDEQWAREEEERKRQEHA